MKSIFLLPIIILATSIGFIFPSPIRADIYCQDNNTLVENQSVYLNGTWFNFSTPTFCGKNLCDNITSSCDPPLYIQPFLFVGIIIGIIFFVILMKFSISKFIR